MLNQNNNKLLVPQSQFINNQLKEEIAQEFGITLGADTSSRDNGRIGGEMTKRLIKLGLEQLQNQNKIH